MINLLMNKEKKTIGLLGVTADPPTLGHIEIAEFVLQANIGIDEVWIMPCYSHTFEKEMKSPEDRLEMCHIACKDQTNIKVFDFEISNKIHGITYNVLEKLLADDFITSNYSVKMIIGQDNANILHKWQNHEKLINLISFIVVPRIGFQFEEDSTWCRSSPHIFLGDHANPIPGTSSTEARNILKTIPRDYKKLEQLIDKNVLKFIEEKNLY